MSNSTSAGGGIGGWFRSVFGADDDPEYSRYSSAVESGGAVVTVRTDEDRMERAAEILNRNGAIDVDEQGSESLVQSDVNDLPRSGFTNTARLDADRAEQVIPVVEEELAIGKRTVRRGGVRIISQIQETPVQEQVTLRDKTVRVERTPVDRPASEADFARSGESIEVTEMSEEPVVSKQARVVEEVVVGKESTERTETIRDTVRRTEVEVEDLGTDLRTEKQRKHD